MISYNNINSGRSRNENVTNLCQQYEDRDRYIATRCLEEAFKGYEVNFTGTDLTCPVDLVGTVSDGNVAGKFNVEVKERNKSPEYLKKYPTAELRVDKAKRMASVTPPGTVCLYIVLLNDETGYIYNLSCMDWSKVSVFDWRIKKTQVDSTSGYEVYPTYAIPMDLAVRKIDIRDYIQEWNNSLK